MQVVDFFSGCGGTSQGFRQLGLDVRVGLDLDPAAAASFRANFPEAAFIEADIRTVAPARIAEHLTEDETLFSGCAPCQPFSKQSREGASTDPRWNLLSEFQRFVLALRPTFVVLENVPGLQRVGKSGPLPRFLQSLADAGYEHDLAVLRAGELGVPQSRRRLVVVASRVGLARLPTPHKGGPTVRDAISHFPPLSAGETDPDDADHSAMGLSPLNLERIQATPEGGTRRDWPQRLQLACHKRHQGHSDVYGRMAWDAPASGLTTRCLSYSNGRFGHPSQDRAISAREAAALQTFPDSFQFHGTLTEKGRQIGNAVPPAMAFRIAETLISG